MAVLLVLIGAANSCTAGSQGKVTLNSASVDPAYSCPPGVDNAPYTFHATLEVRNSTSTSVTIKSVAAAMTLAAVKGPWLARIGDKYQASGVTFAPATVKAGASTLLQVAIPSACTNGTTANGASYGDYSVDLVVNASSGTYSIVSKNRHRIVAS